MAHRGESSRWPGRVGCARERPSQCPSLRTLTSQSPFSSRGAHISSPQQLSQCHTRSTRTSSPTWRTAPTPTTSTAPTSTTTTTTSPAETTTTTPSSRTRTTITTAAGQGPQGLVSTVGPSLRLISLIRGQCQASITSCTTDRSTSPSPPRSSSAACPPSLPSTPSGKRNRRSGDPCDDPDDDLATTAKYVLASGSFGQPDTTRPTQFILKSKVFSTFIHSSAERNRPKMQLVRKIATHHHQH